MKLLEFLKNHKTSIFLTKYKINNAQKITDKDKIAETLDDYSEKFLSEKLAQFDKEDNLENITLYNSLFNVRNNNSLSYIIQENLLDSGIYISQYAIKKYLDCSEKFNLSRQAYESRLVKKQIELTIKRDNLSLIAIKRDDFAIYYSPKVENTVRENVKLALTSANMDSETIERGLEENADIWRRKCIERSFENIFEPEFVIYNSPKPAEPDHKQSWIALREYRYYQKHKDSIDKYGTPTENMLLSDSEVEKLKIKVAKQNIARLNFIEDYKTKIKNHNKEDLKEM